MFPYAEIQVIEVATSDHLPLFLHLNKKIYVQKEKRFQLENIWLREKECRKIVKNGWEKTEGMSIVEKIRYCGVKLQDRGGGESNEYKIKIQNCRREIRKLRSRRDIGGIQHYNAVRLEYLRLLDNQEIYWKQRSKQFWLQEGDKNTQFFHMLESKRRKNNQLEKIKDDQGIWREKTDEIRGVIEDYFSRLFTASNIDGKLLNNEDVKQVSASDNEKLIADITSEEVKQSVFS